MKHERIELGVAGAYMDTYFLESSEKLRNSWLRPLILVCPGGGYVGTADREAEPIALAFAAKGFHTAVLRYPVAPNRFPTALYSLGKAMLWLKAHAEENHIDAAHIAVTGYSAGGHLAASLGVFWNRPFLTEALGCDPEQLRPCALILGYPVITSGEFAHRGSFINLLGEEASEEMLEMQALEKQVTADTPTTFLWHTCADQGVPVENSLLFASALRRAGVSFELHVYSEGVHGLALGSEITANAEGNMVCEDCVGWVDLAAAWFSRETGWPKKSGQ